MAERAEILCVTTGAVPGRPVREVLRLAWGIRATNQYGNPSRQSQAADAARRAAYGNPVGRARSMGANVVAPAAADGFVAARGDRGGWPVDREHTVHGAAVIPD